LHCDDAITAAAPKAIKHATVGTCYKYAGKSHRLEVHVLWAEGLLAYVRHDAITAAVPKAINTPG
jgi:hypothetical protein